MHKTTYSSMFQGPGHLDDNVQSFGLIINAPGGQIVVHRFALDVLHDEIVVAAGLADVDGLNDVGVVELGGGLALPVEALDVLGVLREPSRQNLHRDNAVQTQLAGLEDRRHRTRADVRKDLIAGDLPALARLLDLEHGAVDLPLRDHALVDQNVGECLGLVVLLALGP